MTAYSDELAHSLVDLLIIAEDDTEELWFLEYDDDVSLYHYNDLDMKCVTIDVDRLDLDAFYMLEHFLQDNCPNLVSRLHDAIVFADDTPIPPAA